MTKFKQESENYRTQLSYIAFLLFVFVTVIILKPERSDSPIAELPEALIEVPVLPSNIPDFAAINDVSEKRPYFLNS